MCCSGDSTTRSPPLSEQTPMWNPCRIPWSPEESLAPPQILISLRRTSHDDNDNYDDDDDDDEEPPLVRRRLEFNSSSTSNDQLGTQLAAASQQLIPMARVQPTVTTTTDWMSSDSDIMSESEVEDDDNDSEFEQAMDVLASLADIITRTVRVLRGNRWRRRN